MEEFAKLDPEFEALCVERLERAAEHLIPASQPIEEDDMPDPDYITLETRIEGGIRYELVVKKAVPRDFDQADSIRLVPTVICTPVTAAEMPRGW